MTTREIMLELARVAVAETLTITNATADAIYNEAFALAVNALYRAGYDGSDLTDVAVEVAAIYSLQGR